MKSKFSVDFFSDEQYKYLTAEILYNGQVLCQINRDNGIENMEVEFFHDQYILEEEFRMKFPINDFLSVIEDVKNELK